MSSHPKKPSLLDLPGVQLSKGHNQVLISSGIPSLDYHLGNGLPLGSIFFLQEDLHNVYSNVLCKLFISEGVVNHHVVLHASMDHDAPFDKLPKLVQEDISAHTESQEKFNIAWRYQSQKTQSPSFGHFYDMTRKMPDDVLASSTLISFNSNEDAPNHYKSLLCLIQSTIDEHTCLPSSAEQKILRICIESVPTPSWGDPCDGTQFEFSKFLFSLKALLRKSLAVCMVTIPTQILSLDYQLRIVDQCDYGIKLESLDSHKEQSLYKDYNGLLTLVKLNSLNSLAPISPDTVELAFKLRQKRFSVERLHLPPDLSAGSFRPEEMKSKDFLCNKDFDF